MHAVPGWIQWLPAALYGLGAFAGAFLPQATGWSVLAIVSRSALAVAVSQATWILATLRTAPAVETSGAEALVLLLVAFLGWIIGDYSRRYLRGEAGQARFVTAFMATLAAISTVVASDNLALSIAAWVAGSAALHHLLTFYPDRPAAIVVAHKKFLTSRLAELCLVTAAALLYREWGTLELASINAQATAATALPLGANLAAVLVAAAVLLKCAQLPLHGWLIQVMEAPTPVSALLHAGVVNLGGYALIRLAPLVGASTAANTLLVVFGGLTALLAGLIMLTRISIKVRLAWSTCSQMGLMILECGLGLYDVALLHLLAHALYKAHAFLTSGDVVRGSLRGDPPPGRSRAVLSAWLPALALGIVIVVFGASSAAWHRILGTAALAPLNVAWVALGLSTLLWSAPRSMGAFSWRLGAVLLATQAYLGWHALFSFFLPLTPAASPWPLQAWALLVFIALHAAQAWVFLRSESIPKPFYEWIYAGLHLDEGFTRLTFRLWPPSRPAIPPESHRRQP